MGDVAGYVLIGVLALLAIQEIIRYRRCQQDEREIPYPRRSLIRRLTITLDFIFLLLLAMFWPQARPVVQMILMALVGFAALIGFFMLWRDLRETSLNVVNQATRMNEDASRELAQAIRKRNPEKKHPKPND